MTKEKYVAYVEDDPDDVVMLSESLDREANLAVRPFPNDSNLLEFLHAVSNTDYPCLILLDKVTYELTAQDTVVLLRENTAFALIPVAVLTTSLSPEETEEFTRQGVPVFLKPVSLEGLTALSRELVGYCSK